MNMQSDKSNRSNNRSPRACRLLAVVALAAGSAAAPVLLADAPASQPGADAPQELQQASMENARPVLEELNRETQSLYKQFQSSMFHVQMPPPTWNNMPAEAVAPGIHHTPTTRSASIGMTIGPIVVTQSSPQIGPQVIIYPAETKIPNVAATTGPGGLGKAGAPVATAADFEPNDVGLVLDAQGHVLIPTYVVGQTDHQPVRLAGPDGAVIDARFVGSDKLTNLTIVQISKADLPKMGKPVKLSAERPPDGALVMYIQPFDGAARIGLWTGAAQDYGLVVTLDGQLAGINRFGQMLSGASCKLIADEIIKYGVVKRATLGVTVREVQRDDGLRKTLSLLHDQPAVSVLQVMRNSPAEQAGIRQGDLILSLAGDPVGDPAGLAAAIAARDGQTQVKLLRDDHAIVVTVNLHRH